jgi:transposase
MYQRRYSNAVKADVRRRMGPPRRQSVAPISADLGIHIVILYNWRKARRLQGEVVPASVKDPDVWSAASCCVSPGSSAEQLRKSLLR